MSELGEKMCTGCNVIKSLDAFHRQARCRDGRRSRCKTCYQKWASENSESIARRSADLYRKDKERINAVSAEWRQRNRESVKHSSAKWRSENKEQVASANREYKNKNAHRLRAHRAVRSAVERGDILRQPCVQCGATDDVDAHHHISYQEENWLDVMWLCRPHHSKWHIENGKVL